ncbi:MAG: hypothetical protein KJ558_03125 [Gammaproteobacteria bacterium]|nr:hypothetical protein [Gammaproteobacteria bacterium]MBU1653818.1 hypothetical protein [Gammaproteobacteria bacterium]MBU1962146.1 hypothetical protein [Gammaproteobacteria bacterium]
MKRYPTLLVMAVLLLTSGGGWGEEYPLAGLKPDQRPAGAPVLTETGKGDAWHQRAMTGISTPYPDSLGFLADQGNWYTPFDHPGMTGPYDLRGWHD